MAEPTRDFEQLRKEQAKDDSDLLDLLDKESKEHDKVWQAYGTDVYCVDMVQDSEIDRIMKAFRANAYDVLDLAPGVPPTDIKKAYRRKSLLIHPDKSSNPRAQEAFDRLAQAHQALLDDALRAKLDEAIADARYLLIKERKLTTDSEEVKDPDQEFMKAWRDKVKYVLADNEARRQRQMKAQMQEEGREQRKADEAAAERKRKHEQEKQWENTRDERIGQWRDYQKKTVKPADGGPKKKKIKVLG